MSNNIDVLLVGTGYMGKEYSKVLKAQGVSTVAVCNREESAKGFENETGIKTYCGGINCITRYIESLPNHAIVAVPVDQLATTVMGLIRLGVLNILVEKPAGLNKDEISEVVNSTKENGANVFVAYNRRFYASTEKAMEIISLDGGVSSFNFEFTEWSFKISETKHSPVIKEEWMLANSSHVIDLAFFLGGFPKEFCSYTAGSLSWHSRASIYSGAGISEKGALFSYQANWDAPGRWAVEMLTNNYRLYFKPMEKLLIQKKGSIIIEEVPLDDHLDIEYKPGLFNQVKGFMRDNVDSRLLGIEEQLSHMKYYEQIEGII